ncbi:MAG: hypothetical protein M3151_12680 [Actinomycetota bacterium]|nr:hypothetical protein [Actinomycetota bacterium]
MRDEKTSAADAGIWLQSGSSSSDNVNFCANVGGSGGLANTFTTAPVEAPAGIADFVLDLRFANSKLRLPGYTGTTTTDRQNYLLGRNTGFTNFAQDGVQNPVNEAGVRARVQRARPRALLGAYFKGSAREGGTR